MAKETFATLKKVFKEWDENRTKLEYKNKKVKGVFVAADDEEFRPLYTTDKDNKFYKVRKDMPINYWISNKGNMINVGSKTIYAMKPSVSGSGREQYEININGLFKPDPAKLVVLAFDGKATQKALELINKYGVDAIKSNNHKPAMVEIHHISHYEHADKENISELRAENCRLDNIELIATDEHSVISNAPIYRDGMKSSDKVFDELSKKLGQLGKDPTKANTIVVEQTGARKQAGDIYLDDEHFLKYHRQLNSKEPWFKYVMEISEIPRTMSDKDFIKCLIALVEWKPEDFKKFIEEDERGKEFLKIYQNEKFKSEPKCIEYIIKYLEACAEWGEFIYERI